MIEVLRFDELEILNKRLRIEKKSRKNEENKEKEDNEDSFSQLRSFLVPLLRPQTGIHRNERGGENAFAEEILQEVRNAEGGSKGICGV